ncbi:MAG: histidine--tRNA ligase [Flavisolibacter sp.]
MTKPGIPQGTRDMGPETVRKRQFIFNTIQSVFELYGFQPIETPAIENLDTLMGNYGDEGDKLIFKILNNGLNDPKNSGKAKLAFENVLKGKNDKDLTERALRYDLTIPFARYVAMNYAQLTLPFKRYQIQPVWRADRPQKGRYREFYQCDADIVGSKALINEIELVHLYHEVFTRLRLINYDLRINSRKILTALAQLCGGTEKMLDLTIAIDKLDKTGIENTKKELEVKGLTKEALLLVESYIHIRGTNENKLEQLKALFKNSEMALSGIEEINYILERVAYQDDLNITVDFSLARGLNYYTGIIFEVKAPHSVKMGSIGGGGRYDDLTGLFGIPNTPGIGISFGVDRIYDVMEELKLFPQHIDQKIKVLFLNLGTAEAKVAYSILQKIRGKGVAGEIFPDEAKVDKQYKYAERKKIPYVAIMGAEEIKENLCRIKNLATGTQQALSLSDVPEFSFS